MQHPPFSDFSMRDSVTGISVALAIMLGTFCIE